MNRREYRRRRLWRPGLYFGQDPKTAADWDKKLKSAREIMPVFDGLPAAIRHAMNESTTKFDTKQVAQMLDALASRSFNEIECIDFVIRTIRANERRGPA